MSEVLMQAHYPIMRAAATGNDRARSKATPSDKPSHLERSTLLDFSLVGPRGLLPVLER
jgi:hypothetical protein